MFDNIKRKNYLINAELQGHYTFNILIIIAAACLFYVFLIGYVSSDSIAITYGDNGLHVGTASSLIMHNILKAQWIFMVTGGVLIAVVSILVTHRFAGPLYRFENSVKNMIKGDHTFRIKLRNKDEGVVLADLLNQYNKSLAEDIWAIKEATYRLREQLNEIEEATEQERVYDAFETLHTIENKLRRFKVNH